MDPVTITAITTAAVAAAGASSASQQAVQDAYINLKELISRRYSDAKTEYKAREVDIKDEVEIMRQNRLDELGELQTRAILTVSDGILLERVVVISLDLTINAFEAITLLELDVIERRIVQLNTALDRYDIDQRNYLIVRVVAIILSVIAFAIIFIGAIWGSSLGLDPDYVIPVLGIPLSVIMWSAIGSFTSVLYRLNRSTEKELRDPIRWMISRPIVGVMMGILVFLAVKVGFLATTSGQAEVVSTEVIWLLAFLAGFSDRFAASVLKSIVGRFGLDNETDTMAVDYYAKAIDLINVVDVFRNDTEIKDTNPGQGIGKDQSDSTKQGEATSSSESRKNENKTSENTNSNSNI